MAAVTLGIGTFVGAALGAVMGTAMAERRDQKLPMGIAGGVFGGAMGAMLPLMFSQQAAGQPQVDIGQAQVERPAPTGDVDMTVRAQLTLREPSRRWKRY